MTLYELVNGIEVQGAVRVSCFDDDGKEHILYECSNLDDFCPCDLEEEWEDRVVTFLFCTDNVLHFEIENV